MIAIKSTGWRPRMWHNWACENGCLFSVHLVYESVSECETYFMVTICDQGKLDVGEKNVMYRMKNLLYKLMNTEKWLPFLVLYSVPL